MNPRFAEIFNKIPFGLILVVYLAYVGYGYYDFINDENGPLHQKQGQLVTAREDIRKLEKKVKDVNDFMQTLNAKKQELRQLAQALEDTKATLSENIDIPDLMNVMYTEARRAGLAVSRLNPTGVKKFEFYEAHEFSFQSTGVFFQYVSFLDRIASLQKIVRLNDIHLTPVSAPGSSFVKLSAEMHIYAYRYLGSKADELGKNDASANHGSATPVEKKVGP